MIFAEEEGAECDYGCDACAGLCRVGNTIGGLMGRDAVLVERRKCQQWVLFVPLQCWQCSRHRQQSTSLHRLPANTLWNHSKIFENHMTPTVPTARLHELLQVLMRGQAVRHGPRRQVLPHAHHPPFATWRVVSAGGPLTLRSSHSGRQVHAGGVRGGVHWCGEGLGVKAC